MAPGGRLYNSIEVGGDQGAEGSAEWKPEVVGEHSAGVNDCSMNEFECSEIVFEAMAYQDSVSIDETHQIILHLLQVLGGSPLKIMFRDSRESSIIIRHLIIGEDKRFIHQPTIHTHHCNLGAF